MSIKHSLLAAAYGPLRLKTYFFRSVLNSKERRLRVLIVHDIAPEEEKFFYIHLKNLKKTWHFIDPKTFEGMITGEIPVEKDNLLLTFDDGFISSRHVVDSVLDKLNIKALHFVVSEFVGQKGDDWRGFVANNINPHMHPEEVPEHCRNMNAEDLRHLIREGHSIGAHTANHARLSQLSGTELIKEIIESADELEKLLSINVEHFAYTFGNLSSFSQEALAVARKRFQYIYTGFRGNNAQSPLSWAINRDSIKPEDSDNLTGAFLEGGADRLYAKDMEIFRSWGKVID
jgi:peptidoglycan/xylan/chitin deacetylase (PgdA/CDA1 family)